MRKSASWLLLTTIALILISSTFNTACSEENAEQEYQEFRAGLIEKYNAGEYAEAAKLIEENYDRFPGRGWKMSYNMAAVCKHLEDCGKGIEYLKMAHQKGQWFNTWAFEGDFWAPYREQPGFEEILARNLKMKDEVQKNSEAETRGGPPRRARGRQDVPAVYRPARWGQKHRGFQT